MTPAPIEVSLEVTPRARVDVIDVRDRAVAAHAGLQSFPKALYCSYHTTAGYLEQGLASRLNQASKGIHHYLQVFQAMFPEGAGYRHDNVHLRHELPEHQRDVEPRNADAHLAFIGAGLRNCVQYVNRPCEPVYFIDLDGINGGRPRRRLTSILAFNVEEVVARQRLEVPVSAHPVDSVNLKDPRFGLYSHVGELIARHGVGRGRIHLSLAAGEHQAGLTINEYETLLMRHDLFDVLRDPLRFMAEKGRHLLADPWAIPNKTIDYAKYDMVRLFNELFDTFRMNESLVEKILARMIAVPARRFLRMKRSVSLLISDRDTPGRGVVAGGAYQSPILVQWQKASGQRRLIDVTLTRIR
jgi:thiamine phosphate synthase YjbQ (UPF0047 family)